MKIDENLVSLSSTPTPAWTVSVGDRVGATVGDDENAITCTGAKVRTDTGANDDGNGGLVVGTAVVGAIDGVAEGAESVGNNDGDGVGEGEESVGDCVGDVESCDVTGDVLGEDCVGDVDGTDVLGNTDGDLDGADFVGLDEGSMVGDVEG